MVVFLWASGPYGFFYVRVLGDKGSLLSKIMSIFLHWILLSAIIHAVSLILNKIKKKQ